MLAHFRLVAVVTTGPLYVKYLKYRGTGKESDFRTKNLIATCQRKKIKIPVSWKTKFEKLASDTLSG